MKKQGENTMLYYIIAPTVILGGIYLIANLGLFYSTLIVIAIMYIIVHTWEE